jgi:hypothetical protein
MDDLISVQITTDYTNGHLSVELHLSFPSMAELPQQAHINEVFKETRLHLGSSTTDKTDSKVVSSSVLGPRSREDELLRQVEGFKAQVEVLAT